MAVLLTGKPVADALSADTRTRAEALLSKGVQPVWFSCAAAITRPTVRTYAAP